MRAENVRSEVTDVTGIVKYIGKTAFRHTFSLYSVAYVPERRERVFKLFPISISREFSKSFGPV